MEALQAELAKIRAEQDALPALLAEVCAYPSLGLAAALLLILPLLSGQTCLHVSAISGPARLSVVALAQVRENLAAETEEYESTAACEWPAAPFAQLQADAGR